MASAPHARRSLLPAVEAAEAAPPSGVPGRKRRRCVTSVITSWALLCSLACRCEALSIPGRRSLADLVRGQKSLQLQHKLQYGSSALAGPFLGQKSLQLQHNLQYDGRSRTFTRPSIRRKRASIGRWVRDLRDRMPIGKGQPLDDTQNSGYSSSSMGARNARSNNIRYNPLEARTSRVQTLANSPLSLAARSSSSSSTALQMVLSTPDPIIEQASTQKLLDTLIDESLLTQSRQPVMMQFNPKRGWIWRQWRGTVFAETWKSALLNMALATFGVFLYKLYPGLKDMVQGFSILWGQLLSVTTFTLTFFLNQSYGLWRKCYDYSRRLQGRLNDLGMTLAAHATRNKPSSPDVPSTYTPQSRQALELVSRYVRVFNLLTYASFTRSHRPILTPRGMRRMVERGILTPKEREILSEAEVPATQRHNAVLVWLMRLFLEGRQTGVFEGGMGFEQQFMEKCHVIRAQYGAIGDELQGRMPLAYAHIVQVLLDVVLWMYPFMALSTGMAWHISILGTGLLTMFYQGLFDLAKQFLDPYDNENYGKGDDPLVIDTLIAETNAGSVRWMNSFNQQPWSQQLLNDGELYDSILPQRGYSVEELLEMERQEEQERRERELAREEKKRKEEEAARQRAEELLKGHVANTAGNRTFAAAEKRNGTAVLTPAGEVLMGSYEGINGNKTFLAVAGGEIVSASSLLPSSTVFVEDEMEIGSSDSSNATAVETESNKVLTLADGTLVTMDDTLTINATEELNLTATQAVEDAALNITSMDAPLDEEETAPTEMDIPPLLDSTNEVAWDQFGQTPDFEESIAEMESYKATHSVPLYDTQSESIYDQRLSDTELQDFDWFDEIGEDGQEYRLSQMLADEEWSVEEDEDNAAENKTMTYEEFAQKATEMIEQAENELAETKEIMGVSPGSSAEYDVTSRGSGSSIVSSPTQQRVMVDEPQPLYDQTRLDGISQLWGAPPEVLEGFGPSDDDDSDQEIINDGQNFQNIYSLWGEDVPSDTASLDEEESAPSSSSSMDGFSQLWSENLSPYTEYDPTQPGLNGDTTASDFSAYAGLDWWDMVSEDGKELRLSQMLADEEYEEEADEEEDETPMTFEQFAEETEKLIEEFEDERKETEAIMRAPPAAEFVVEADDVQPSDVFESVADSDEFNEMLMSMADGEEEPSDVFQSVADSDEFNEMLMSMAESVGEEEAEAEEIVSAEDIDVLAMDDIPEEEGTAKKAGADGEEPADPTKEDSD